MKQKAASLATAMVLPESEGACTGWTAGALKDTDQRAIAASRVANAHKLAMADAVMYAVAQEFDATFWTQDVDYQGLDGVRYCAKPARGLP